MVLALFDAVSEFVGFLEIGLTILIIKEGFGLITGGAGAGGGGISLPGWLGGRGGADLSPGGVTNTIGAETAAETNDQRVAADEAKLGQQQAMQRTEEIREAQDINSITKLSIREGEDLSRMIEALGNIINTLKNGSVTRNMAARQQIGDKIAQLLASRADFRTVHNNLINFVNQLDTYEQAEITNLRGMLTTAKDSLYREALAKRGRDTKGRFMEMAFPVLRKDSANEAKWEKMQRNYITDASRRASAELNSIRKKLDVRIRQISDFERRFELDYLSARNFLAQPGSTSMSQAIKSLESARRKLQEAKKIDDRLRRFDLPQLRNDVAKKYRDLKIENELRQRIGMSVKRSTIVGSAARKQISRLKGKGMSMVSVFGRIRNIRIRR